ncbi:MAG: hypothetical protein HY303_18960 [Candidatus Wallbacteria bacterium]|nr:hypothetical protein [Candidatus Wallbacteria bacterium]
MTRKDLKALSVTAVAVALNLGGVASVLAGDLGAQYADVVEALPQAKFSIEAGIKQLTRAPEACISCKYEIGDDGKLSLSIYTAQKGLSVLPEENPLIEYAGSPASETWAPSAEVFKDPLHVARAASHLTVMAQSCCSLLDILRKAQCMADGGTVFRIDPMVRDGKAQIVVLVAHGDRVDELAFDR